LKLLTLTGQLQEKALSREQRTDEKEKDRQAAFERAKQHDETITMLGNQAHEARMEGYKNAAEKNKFMSIFLSGKTQDANEAEAHTLIGNASNAYNMIPMTNIDAKVAAANRFNALLDSYGEKYSDAMRGYTRLTPTRKEGFLFKEEKPLPGLAPPKKSPAAVQETTIGPDGKTYNVITKNGKKFVDPNSGR
jgi:hypothetical protein